MNNILNLQKSSSHTVLLFVVALVTMLSFSLFGIQSAFAMITSQLDIGSRGSEVTELQSYLATSASIYPSGLVTGYFGPLTQAGVQKFQIAQGIVSSGTPESTGFGRVGPITMAKINSLLGGSVVYGNQTYWDTVPILSNPSVSVTSTSATISWTTNEPTQGQVYWDTMPLRAEEATGPRQQPYVSGNLALDAGGMTTSHSVTISNLVSDKTYHFLTRGVDSVGNMSMVWPTTFHTN